MQAPIGKPVVECPAEPLGHILLVPFMVHRHERSDLPPDIVVGVDPVVDRDGPDTRVLAQLEEPVHRHPAHDPAKVLRDHDIDLPGLDAGRDGLQFRAVEPFPAPLRRDHLGRDRVGRVGPLEMLAAEGLLVVQAPFILHIG